LLVCQRFAQPAQPTSAYRERVDEGVVDRGDGLAMPLKIHFLNVGHGDCTFVEFPSGRLAMIDINNSKSLPDGDLVALASKRGMSVETFSSRKVLETGFRTWKAYYESLLVDPMEYYKAHFNGRSIFRYIQTHPDMDHMGGLHRFFWQEGIELGCFWDVAHGKKKSKKDFESGPHSYDDWLAYTRMREGYASENDVKANTKSLVVIKNLRGAVGEYWTDDNIEVLSPSSTLISSCNKNDEYNNCSYVLRITHAGRAVILPGDAESAAWSSILDAYDASDLRCDVLKAAHHGRESGYHEKAVAAMAPKVVICSVGEKPDTDASDEYTAQGAKVVSTRSNGTMTLTIKDNGTISIRNHKGERIYRAGS
jgi:competence protein ComEC